MTVMIRLMAGAREPAQRLRRLLYYIILLYSNIVVLLCHTIHMLYYVVWLSRLLYDSIRSLYYIVL